MDILGRIDGYVRRNMEFALVTLVEVNGSAPQIAGAKMIVFQDGSIEGTIGGGKVEKKAIEDARAFIRRRRNGLKEYSLNRSEGMLCGGTMRVFFETFKPDKRLIIVGAGHVGLATYRLAEVLGYKITVIDNRKEFASRSRFPNATVKVGDCAKLLAGETFNSHTYVSIATHGHAHDLESLRAVLNARPKAGYVGMIGSRNKIGEHFAILAKEGVDRKVLKTIHAPIGLKLGGAAPEEIALAILAEMQAVEYKIKGSLRFKSVI